MHSVDTDTMSAKQSARNQYRAREQHTNALSRGREPEPPALSPSPYLHSATTSPSSSTPVGRKPIEAYRCAAASLSGA